MRIQTWRLGGALAMAIVACDNLPPADSAGTGPRDLGAGDAGTPLGADGATSGGGDAARPSGDASAPPTPASGLFEKPHPWNTRVDGVAKSASSDTIIRWLAGAGGWGTGTFRMDMTIEVLAADAATPKRSFTLTEDFFSPDCDSVPFPVPAGGALEGESGYACEGDGDCHLLVVHGPEKKLYEMWRANIAGGTFFGGCAVVWDLTKQYGPALRGDGCTSADGAGFPITAMLASPDEVFAGEVAHALRFTIPNERIRRHVFVHPGTHTTGPTSGPGDAPPYGVRLRLRASYPVDSLPTAGARVLARALQRYGMFLADGGQVPLTVQSDRFTRHKWRESGVDEGSLETLRVSDFEVVELGTPITSEPDCARIP